MTKNRLPLLILQWVLGLVLLEASLRFAFSAGAAREFAKTGPPNFLHIGLAWAEIAAAILFLIPRATIIGGRFLIAVLGVAIVIHILHGWFDVGALVVYGAAAWVVVAAKTVLPVKRT
jgi:hypothetical protein